ncbi:hypothetical protein [Providencia stuartii]|uniref:hypothetical protein n=1 Tax=Providencia stuartii TaxID=588 RepID=UPI000CE66DB9|nr:hypothetical protein AM353_10790 [Providencia stuartii]
MAKSNQMNLLADLPTVGSTDFPKTLVSALFHANKNDAWMMNSDADYCQRKLLEYLVVSSRVLAEHRDEYDISHDELRSLGDGIAMIAELILSCNHVTTAYKEMPLNGTERQS